jgi:diketogulonate reductase-like aldo/keto reductase
LNIIDHFEENYAARDIKLSAEDVQALENIFETDKISGDRYPNRHLQFNSKH